MLEIVSGLLTLKEYNTTFEHPGIIFLTVQNEYYWVISGDNADNYTMVLKNLADNPVTEEYRSNIPTNIFTTDILFRIECWITETIEYYNATNKPEILAKKIFENLTRDEKEQIMFQIDIEEFNGGDYDAEDFAIYRQHGIEGYKDMYPKEFDEEWKQRYIDLIPLNMSYHQFLIEYFHHYAQKIEEDKKANSGTKPTSS